MKPKVISGLVFPTLPGSKGAVNFTSGIWSVAATLALLLPLLVHGNPSDMSQSAGGDTVIDMQSLLALAEKGDARASFLLGTRYASGRAGVINDREAVRWFSKAAEQGLPEAQYNVGSMYATGRGVAQDWTQAVRWYRLAAEQGTPEAQYNLGTLYGLGRGVARDEVRAAEWLRRAAEQGLVEAQFNLAVLYEHGRGVAADPGRAVSWYESAAAQGHAPANERLAALGAKPERPKQSASARPTAPGADQEPKQSDPSFQSSNGPSDLKSVQSGDWLMDLDPRHFTLQVASYSEEARAKRLIRQHRLESDAAYFRVLKGDRTLYSVVVGVYPTQDAAGAAKASLPEALRKTKPWVRSVGAIQEVMIR